MTRRVKDIHCVRKLKCILCKLQSMMTRVNHETQHYRHILLFNDPDNIVERLILLFSSFSYKTVYINIHTNRPNGVVLLRVSLYPPSRNFWSLFPSGAPTDSIALTRVTRVYRFAPLWCLSSKHLNICGAQRGSMYVRLTLA